MKWISARLPILLPAMLLLAGLSTVTLLISLAKPISIIVLLLLILFYGGLAWMLRLTLLHQETQLKDSQRREVMAKTQAKRELAEQSDLQQTVVNHVGQGISVFDKDLNMVICNDQFFELLDFPREWKGQKCTFEQMLRYNAERGEYGPGDAEQQVAERLLLARNPVPHRLERVRPNGVILEVQGYPMPDGGFVTTYTDITARKEAEEKLQLAATVLETANESIMICDAHHRIQSVNPAFSLLTGYPAEEVLGKKPGFLKSGRHDRTFYKTIWQSLDETGSWQGEIWYRHKGGELFAAWISLAAIKDNTGHVTHYVSIAQDITLRKEDEERIWRRANFDVVTGLPNRALFMDRLALAIAQARRHNSGFALLFIDLDGFKEVNDKLGHGAGDCLLQEAAKRLCSGVRASDTVARLGGDEFTIILNGIDEMEKILKIVDNLTHSLLASLSLEGVEFRIQASIGIALYPRDGDNAASLLKQADATMYQAKKKKKETTGFPPRHYSETLASADPS